MRCWLINKNETKKSHAAVPLSKGDNGVRFLIRNGWIKIWFSDTSRRGFLLLDIPRLRPRNLKNTTQTEKNQRCFCTSLSGFIKWKRIEMFTTCWSGRTEDEGRVVALNRCMLAVAINLLYVFYIRCRVAQCFFLLRFLGATQINKLSKKLSVNFPFVQM
jgi:hypothetical protein